VTEISRDALGLTRDPPSIEGREVDGITAVPVCLLVVLLNCMEGKRTPVRESCLCVRQALNLLSLQSRVNRDISNSVSSRCITLDYCKYSAGVWVSINSNCTAYLRIHGRESGKVFYQKFCHPSPIVQRASVSILAKLSDGRSTFCCISEKAWRLAVVSLLKNVQITGSLSGFKTAAFVQYEDHVAQACAQSGRYAEAHDHCCRSLKVSSVDFDSKVCISPTNLLP
jgi:hypothetical protein